MEKQSLKHLIIASALAFVVTLGTTISFLPIKGNDSKRHPDWMKSLPDSTALTSLALPGSHDAAAFYSLEDLAGKCQDASITQQLNYGVRFLDVRLMSYKDNLYLCHGIVNEGQGFKKLAQEVYNFLDTNPSETIIMSVKEEAKAQASTQSFESLFYTAIEQFLPYWSLDTSLPSSLGAIRKKIILLSRYEHNTIGIPAYEGWEDSTTFDLDQMHIQDAYKVSSNEEKWSQIKEAATYAVANPSKLTLNFCSGYLVKGFPPSYSVSTAKYINPKIKDELSKDAKGVLICDFVTPELVDKLLEGNNL